MVTINFAAVRSTCETSSRHELTRRRKNSQQGFTLVELMIGLVLVAILTGIGVPSYRSFILDQRLRATSSDLRIALTVARSEAVKRNRSIELKPSADGWGDGWTIENPTAEDPCDPDDDPDNAGTSCLLVQRPVGDVTIAGPVEVAFSPAGRAQAAADFQIDVGPEASGATGCLRIRSDGRTEYCKQACPFPDPKPDPCPEG